MQVKMHAELMKSAETCGGPVQAAPGGQEAPKDSWVLKPQSLRFAVAGVTLFSPRFQAWVCNADFLGVKGGSAECVPPLERMNSHIRWAIARSQPVPAALPRMAVSGGNIRYVPRQYRRYYIDLRGSFADYLKKFSSKSRSTLLRKIRRFTELCGGQLRWQQFRTPEEMLDFHRLARELSQKTYQEKLLDEGLPESREFVQEMICLAAQDSVRAYLLFFKNRPVAYLYCPVEAGILRYAFQGFDPELWKSSPGTVLQYLALQSLFEEQRYRFFDFTEGEGPTKQFFATGSVQCADICYLRFNLRNLGFVLAHAAIESFSNLAGKVADRLQLRTRMRHFLRFRSLSNT